MIELFLIRIYGLSHLDFLLVFFLLLLKHEHLWFLMCIIYITTWTDVRTHISYLLSIFCVRVCCLCVHVVFMLRPWFVVLFDSKIYLEKFIDYMGPIIFVSLSQWCLTFLFSEFCVTLTSMHCFTKFWGNLF